MSLEAIRRLRTAWSADVSLQNDLNASFDAIGFTDGYIADQVAAIDLALLPEKSKYVKDNIWGMIEVDPASLKLLDCPVLQRLRGIRQLGMSYLTYPSAEHSRFVHSLGVSFVVSEFLRAIDGRSGESPSLGRYVRSSDLGAMSREDLVHAALLHDVGHMPFSHATEKALQANETGFRCGSRRSVAEFLGELEDHTGKIVGLSEALSVLVVLSERFGHFYRRIIRNDGDALLRIACLIAALPPDPRLSGITQIISSAAVDGDKIDYVTRDAQACGIPVGVDVARVFLRSAFVEVARADIIRAGLKENPAPTEVLFVVNASGVDTLDEITQSRATLYQRVYLHPVTRTAEAILTQALRANADAQTDIRNDDLADALGLWRFSDADLLSRLAASRDLITARLGGILRGRQLPKKACVFSASIAEMHMPLKLMLRRIDPGRADDLRKLIVNTPLESLTADELRGRRGEDLAREIRAEAERLVKLLRDKGAPAEVLPTAPLKDLVLVGTSFMDRARKDCIVLQNGELLSTKRFTNIGGTQDAFELVKAVGFVMSDPQWLALVLIAARTILSRPLGSIKPADLPPTRAAHDDESLKIAIVERMLLDLKGVLRRAGVPRGKFDATMEAATQAGYFDAAPLLARPIVANSDAVARIADRLATFEGQREWQVRPETVAAFVNQVPPRLRDCLLARLGEINFLGEQVIADGLLRLLKDITSGADVAPLSPSSGSHVRTSLQRVVKASNLHTWRLCAHISEALAADSDEPLILIDDNTASATQARAQLLKWAGRPVDKWPEECRSEDNLFDEAIGPMEWERLSSRPIKIFVCAGLPQARERLQACAKDLGFKHPLELAYDQEIKEDHTWDADLKAYLTEVGHSVLAWSRCRTQALSEADEAFCRANAFGYGGAGGLLATATNVPTSTVTALWCPGLHNGSPWMPLLIRQNKLRHLVLG
jgi:HD superfamily phosphohydrolase